MTEGESILVFVNDRGVRVPAGSTAAGAVAELDPALADRLGEGGAYLTDGRGIRMEPGAAVFPGAIIRAVVNARTDTEPDADA